MSVSITAAAGSANGTSPAAVALRAWASDERGVVTFGSGTSPATGAQVVLTLGASWSGFPLIQEPLYLLVPMNAATAALGPWYSSLDSTGRLLTIGSAVAPTASQSAGTYMVGYSAVA